jgi:hypothetical protein
MTLSRRSLITGLVSLVASPAIVRASSLMPVKAWAEAPPMFFEAGGVEQAFDFGAGDYTVSYWIRRSPTSEFVFETSTLVSNGARQS